MGNFPSIVGIVEQVRRHRRKEGYNTAQLVVQLNAFGGNWNATHVDDLFAGRVKPTNPLTWNPDDCDDCVLAKMP